MHALVDDPHRPQYHFLPTSGWMNDPNGLIEWQGRYHLFYQYNPNGPFWGTIHWGHAVSEDLVHWAHQPIALAPTPGSPDEDGCWSGCAVDNAGVPTIIYTGARGNQHLPCIATSSDDLLTWQKHPANPLITAPPSGLDLIGFRDPWVWKEGDTWYQIIGAGIAGVGGAALLYRSPDLIHWEYLHPLYVGDKHQTDPIRTGSMWECPQLLPLGDRHLLIVSVWDDGRPLQSAYFLGTYVDQRFTPQTQGLLDYGGHFYAPQVLIDHTGRRIMWGWLWEGYRDQPPSATWAGVLSLPRLLSMRPDGSLAMAPAPELERLRGAHRRLAAIEITPAAPGMVNDIQGDALEISATIDPGTAAACGLSVRCAPDGTEQTAIVYDRAQGRLLIDRSRSSLSSAVQRDVQGGPFALDPGEPLQLRVFLDHSVVEVFANERACLTSRIYPSRSDSLGVGLFTRGGQATLQALDAWEMDTIW